MSTTHGKFSNSLPPAGEERAVEREWRLQQGLEADDRTLDEALMESFPASDPVAVDFSWVVWHPVHSGNEQGKQA